jgi:GcrA cell cycle regulator
MTNLSMGWTDERIEMLKSLYSDGLSASEIADEIGGGLSRNAVIGKAHRLGLPRRRKAAPPIRRNVPTGRRAVSSGKISPRVPGRVTSRETYARNLAAAANRQAAVDIVDLAHDSPHRCTFYRRTGCHWPIGDSSDLNTFMFCNEPNPDDGPYCAFHHSIATETVAARNRRIAERRRERAGDRVVGGRLTVLA